MSDVPKNTHKNDDKKSDSPIKEKETHGHDIIKDIHLIKDIINPILQKLPSQESMDVNWGYLISFNNSHELNKENYKIGINDECDIKLDLKLNEDVGIICTIYRKNENGKNDIFVESNLDDVVKINNEFVKKGETKLINNEDNIEIVGNNNNSCKFKFREKNPLSKLAFSGMGNPNNFVYNKDFIGSFGRRRPARRTFKEVSMGEEALPNTNINAELKIKRKGILLESLQQPKDITFSNFPYYLDSNVQKLLINNAFMFLNCSNMDKFQSLNTISRRILLVGNKGTEMYQSCLVRALANHFNANLLEIDQNFIEESEEEYPSKKLSGKRKKKYPKMKSPSKKDKDKSKWKSQKVIMLDDVKEQYRVEFCFNNDLESDLFLLDSSSKVSEQEPDEVTIESIIEIAQEKQPCIIYIKNVEKTLLNNNTRFRKFKKEVQKLSGKVLVIASSISQDKKDRNRLLKPSNPFLANLSIIDSMNPRTEDRKDPKISKIFPTKISIYPPTKKEDLNEWQKKIDNDIQMMKENENLRSLSKILDKNNIKYEDLDTDILKKRNLSTKQIEKIIGFSLSEYALHTDIIEDAITMKKEHLINAVKLYEATLPPESKSIQDVETENEYEKKLLAEVIPPTEINIKFDDIGALEKTKKSLIELVMLPLQRPELFRKGNLRKPCKGILLFGPPGTGKTMLAKAVATESGANFISISMSSIASKWFGEGEKYTRAVFTLASKISPCVIFVDEIDSLLSRRDSSGEHDAMRKIKNEFMMMWDGLKSKESERIIVLGATNRPFDLDEAVLRRMPRRILVDLPDSENRKKILQVILKDEELNSDVSLDKIAASTEGFSGSDLKNLCISAAYQPIRDFLESEKPNPLKRERTFDSDTNNKIKIKKTETTSSSNDTADTAKDVGVIQSLDSLQVIDNKMDIEPKINNNNNNTTNNQSKETELRNLRMSDFTKALTEISASVSENALSISELRKWNETYGEGGSRKKETHFYYT